MEFDFRKTIIQICTFSYISIFRNHKLEHLKLIIIKFNWKILPAYEVVSADIDLAFKIFQVQIRYILNVILMIKALLHCTSIKKGVWSPISHDYIPFGCEIAAVRAGEVRLCK